MIQIGDRNIYEKAYLKKFFCQEYALDSYLKMLGRYARVVKKSFDESDPEFSEKIVELSALYVKSMRDGYRETVDFSIPTLEERMDYKCLEHMCTQNYLCQLKDVGTGNITSMYRTQVTSFCGFIDFSKGDSTVIKNPQVILPDITYNAVGMSYNEKLVFEPVKRVNKINRLWEMIKDCKCGSYYLHLLVENFCDSEFVSPETTNTIKRYPRLPNWLQKVTSWFTRTETKINNTKRFSVALYDFWNYDENIKLKDVSIKQTEDSLDIFYQPVIKGLNTRFKDDYDEIAKTGKGKIQITIEGIDETEEELDEINSMDE